MEKFTYRVAETQSQEMKKTEMKRRVGFESGAWRRMRHVELFCFMKKYNVEHFFALYKKRYNVEKRHLACKLHDKTLFLVCIQKTNIQL